MHRFGDIFLWDSWDDFGIEIYYNCELVKNIGDFETGHEFDNIQFDKVKMKLYFYKNEGDSDPVLIRVLTCN